jgi:hypothetical protein
MDWVDPPIVGSLEAGSNVNSRPKYGGGFCTIPAWFADQYLDGRDFGVGYGGYRSGQGSSTGPSLFVARRPADYAAALTECLPLISFGGLSAEKPFRERRPADYTVPLWGPAVEDGIGWWQGGDTVVAGPTWIDKQGKGGLCYWVMQGIGAYDYNLQNMCLVPPENLRCRLYVYSPEKIAAVATGDMAPHEIRADFYEWPNQFDTNQTAVRWPIGAHWSESDQRLYIAIRRGSMQQYETAPAIVTYQVNL